MNGSPDYNVAVVLQRLMSCATNWTSNTLGPTNGKIQNSDLLYCNYNGPFLYVICINSCHLLSYFVSTDGTRLTDINVLSLVLYTCTNLPSIPPLFVLSIYYTCSLLECDMFLQSFEILYGKYVIFSC